MSPEQAEGKKVDVRSDIFSFGTVLYEMVTGQRAFAGESNLAILTAILREEPKPASQIVKGLPQELEKIIHRCLRKDLTHRFQHVDDVKVELEELKEDSSKLAETLPARPASPGDSGHPLGQAIRMTRRAWVWVGAAMIVVAIAMAAWLFRGTARKPQAAPEVVPLTSYVGFEQSPSFSPDGNQVAFSWNGEKQDNFDIYVKLIGSPTPLRLTTDPADDFSPAFSPDGRSIGFVRVSKGRGTFIVIPAIGGPDRIVGDVAAPGYLDRSFAWLPDGKGVVTDGLTLLSTETGESRHLTSPPTKSFPDFSPAVSPDGRTVAFSRGSTGYADADIYLLGLSKDLKLEGEPRRLTSVKAWKFGSAWTPNGREIIFGSGVFAIDSSLWKVPASGTGEPEQLQYSGIGFSSPTISPSGNRLAYQRAVSDANIWRLPLSGPGVASGLPVRLIASTHDDTAPQYSPDGRRIAFESNRSGVRGIWVCDANGSNAVELFSRTGAASGTARWSSDGQRIAFDSNMEGNLDIYVIRASGGKPIRLTTDSADDVAPSWSRDGKWVYFSSFRTGRWETWKVSAGGGEAVPMTRNGGETAFESLDCKSIYYTKEFYRPSGLWKMPLSGGEESQVLPSVSWRAFSLVNEGIYFIPAPGADRKSSIQFLSFVTGEMKTVAPLSISSDEGLSVSPDGRSILFTQIDEAGSDLMLVENFR
jgi:Tol biopolymer transport system component